MGRIVTSVTVTNAADPAQSLRCDALVDTRAYHMVLPREWKGRLETLNTAVTVELGTVTQAKLSGDIRGPVQIQLEGFRPTYSEVVFVNMQHDDGQCEPLVGYTVLEQAQAEADMLGHRLVHVKRMDLN